MKHIRKFNESNDENMSMIEDVFSGLSDEWDVNISVISIPSNNEFILSEMISKMDNITLKPSYVKSIMARSWNDVERLPPDHTIIKNMELVKKYLGCKMYQVSINGIKDSPRGIINNEDLVSEIEKYSKVAQSYNLIEIEFINENIGPVIVIFSTYPPEQTYPKYPISRQLIF